MKFSKAKVLCIILLVGVSVFLVSDTVFARAGGGGGGGGGRGGIAVLILYPLLLIYAGIVTYLVMKKDTEAKAVLARLASNDTSWDPAIMKKRIEEIYFKVQDAWMQRNQDIAKDCMSQDLYFRHKMQTDRMISEHRKNILERINLMESRIIGVLDFKDDKKDAVWVYIKGSMYDYMVDDITGRRVSGNQEEAEKFTELWKLVRGAKGWVLDEIDQSVSISDIQRMVAFSE